ncbi:MAG: hypothetical protein QF780_10680, partial [Candidatus Marinimicrobia bacterium]|nr:hypothetical protein [Candidatus Neomarinimicrobiota bacterium]
MNRSRYIVWLALMGYGLALDVTFRYVETPNDDFVRVFVPGSMNDWGPNSDGVISPDAESQMVFNEETGCYERTYDLSLGEEYIYKIHFHYNNSGTNYEWTPDPLNSNMTNDGWNNSILNVTDPLFFQPARHLSDNDEVVG